MKISLSILIAIAFTSFTNPRLAFASTDSSSPASVTESLKIEKAQLEELQTKLSNERRHRRYGNIAIGVSATSMLLVYLGALGAIMHGEQELNMGVKVLMIGGEVGLPSSIAYVLFKSYQIVQLQKSIDAEIHKIDSLIAESQK